MIKNKIKLYDNRTYVQIIQQKEAVSVGLVGVKLKQVHQSRWKLEDGSDVFWAIALLFHDLNVKSFPY